MADKSKKLNQFNPDYAVSPGEVLAGYMDAKELSIRDVADICDCSVQTIITILDGGPISTIMSQGLATATGTAPTLWRNLEREYRKQLASHRRD